MRRLRDCGTDEHAASSVVSFGIGEHNSGPCPRSYVVKRGVHIAVAVAVAVKVDDQVNECDGGRMGVG
jgi:hypothetical protein